MITLHKDLRIGDAERQQAVAALGEHVAAGRLDLAEYDARVQVAWAARTEADLVPLFRDLPSTRPAAARPHRHAPVALFPVVLAAMIAFTVVTHVPPFPLLLLLFWVGAHRHGRGHVRRLRAGMTSSGSGPRWS